MRPNPNRGRVYRRWRAQVATGAAALLASLAGSVVLAFPAQANHNISHNPCARATVTSGSPSCPNRGSTERLVIRRGNIALDVNANTGLANCRGTFPGGTLFVAAAGCHNGRRFSAWRAFTGPARQDIATNVLAGTCYVLVWYGRGNAGRTFQGRVIWPE